VNVDRQRGEVVFEEGYVVLGVSLPVVPEGPSRATFLCVDIESLVFIKEGKFTELNLRVADGACAETKVIRAAVGEWLLGRAPSGPGM
jgi:hypothetical protein